MEHRASPHLLINMAIKYLVQAALKQGESAEIIQVIVNESIEEYEEFKDEPEAYE